MLRPWPRIRARRLTRARPARSIAVIMTAGLAAALTVAAALTGTGTGAQAAAHVQRAAFPLTRIHHVWIIELENTTYAQSFGRPSADPELARAGAGSTRWPCPRSSGPAPRAAWTTTTTRC
jgi:hypothetical protein